MTEPSKTSQTALLVQQLAEKYDVVYVPTKSDQ
jgi:hypothetical protein